MLQWLTVLLKQAGYEIQAAATGTCGEQLFTACGPDAVITEMRLPDIDGIDLVRKMKELHPNTEVVVTGDGNIPRAVEAIKAGAFDFLEKPLDVDCLLKKLDQAITQKALVVENEHRQQRLQDRHWSIAPSCVIAGPVTCGSWRTPSSAPS